jgi:hypothetical protein
VTGRNGRLAITLMFVVVFAWQLYEHAFGLRGNTLLPAPWGAIVTSVGLIAAGFEAWRIFRVGSR